ncbi:imidazolonepropionase [Pedobacter nyackensis]|uniref:Imidazolonepropionase n=1 Tax=Pedobacter nyackensis TaxID=475255 RepID=A0A1W2BPB3_9SPHI|nr:imidazolonepropionase [Pedobacter nyackensis]SMC74795.1 imidazolonepropionase [Pedobacter nyackensis]
MSALFITNIGSLVGLHPQETLMLRGNQMQGLPTLENAWVLCEDGKISDFGKMDQLPVDLPNTAFTHDAKGGFVFPSWCDSHTHIVFAASREEEFVMKIDGKSYEDIAAAGGGILNSARKLQLASEEQLYNSAAIRLTDMIKQGTGAVEIKSGYGLTTDSELKMLRVIRKLKDNFQIPVKASFLAAHAYPPEYKNNHEGYIKLIIDEMLPKIADEGLADYMDAFCEQGFFSVDDTDRLLQAGAKYGLKPKIHANQLSVSGGVQVGVKHQAISVDHLEATDDAVIESLKSGDTIATLLPSCSFYINIPFANARGLINANIPVAVATDYNPGSTPSGNMNLVVSLACIKLRMRPEEAINAATINGAAAMELSREVGSIAKGKKANLFITRPMSSLAFLPYSFGQSQIDTIVLNGKIS